MLLVNDNLRLVGSLYGFGLVEVASEQIVYIEDMIHFAPVHPERLQFSDLRSGATYELYPPKGDRIRADFAGRNQVLMAANKDCHSENGTCDPDSYDEDIRVVRGDENGDFALITALSASNTPPTGKEPGILNTQSALYFYHLTAHGWVYCENEISEEDARRLGAARELRYKDLSSKCSPNLPVQEDASSRKFSAPFPSPHR